jgi:hypothetical protein
MRNGWKWKGYVHPSFIFYLGYWGKNLGYYSFAKRNPSKPGTGKVKSKKSLENVKLWLHDEPFCFHF